MSLNVSGYSMCVEENIHIRGCLYTISEHNMLHYMCLAVCMSGSSSSYCTDKSEVIIKVGAF